jgi:flagellin-like protein
MKKIARRNENERTVQVLRIESSLRKRAISELFATLLMVVVTLIAGAAVLGWVNGQAGSSEQAYGNSAANNINYLNEKFSAESQVFSSNAGTACSGGSGPGAGCTSASFYLYNDGSETFTLKSIQIISTNPIYPLNVVFYTACQTSGSCPAVWGETVTLPAACTVTQMAVNSASYSITPPTGFYVVTSVPGYAVAPGLPQGYLSTIAGGVTYGPYWVSLPICVGGTQLYMYDTVAYTVIFTGLYGNTVQETLTANG